MPGEPDATRLWPVLRTALPLIASASGLTLKLTADRVMLGRFGEESIQAVVPAGLTWFTLACIFIGVAGYVQTFVAQYVGARREGEIGGAVWSGVWVALLGALVLAGLAPAADRIFAWAGHAPAVAHLESAYFRVLAVGAVFALLNAALMGFWSGRGRTLVVMAFGLGTAVLNVGLNVLLIHGLWGCPRLGIVGAAYGTVLSEAAGLAVALVLLFAPAHRRHFGTWPAHCLVPAHLASLVRFGLPAGLHFVLDMLAFNLFVLMLGRLPPEGGANLHEATNLALSVHLVAFLPMIGLGQCAAILVGQAMGGRDPALARRAVASCRTWCLLYMAVLGLLIGFAPDLFLSWFERVGDAGQAATFAVARKLLLFVASWLFFDGLWIVSMSALQGAGDTRFCMRFGVLLAWAGFVLPCAIAWWLGASIWVFWSLLVAYVVVGALVFAARFRSPAWESLSVIGPEAAVPPPPEEKAVV